MNYFLGFLEPSAEGLGGLPLFTMLPRRRVLLGQTPYAAGLITASSSPLKGETLCLRAAGASNVHTFLDLIYALTSNPKITVFSVPFGATLKGAYTAEIIEVLHDGHNFVKLLPVAYMHT
jgi:hypothetical protein